MREHLLARHQVRKATTVDAPDDVERSVDRRAMMRLAGMAAAGAAGAALMTAVDASPAAAGIDGDVVLGVDNSGPTTRTAIIATIPNTEVAGFFQDAGTGAAVRARGGQDCLTFPWSTYNGLGHGVWAESRDGTAVGAYCDTGDSVVARTNSGYGVFAVAGGMYPAVVAGNNLGSGGGLLATTTDASNQGHPHVGPAITAQVLDAGTGRAVTPAVKIVNESDGYGLHVTDTGPNGARGTGAGIWVDLNNTNNGSPAIVGLHHSAGNGVYGGSLDANGVMGVSGSSSPGVGGVAGVRGGSDSNQGVVGVSQLQTGVHGIAGTTESGLAVGIAGVVGEGEGTNGGVVGVSTNGAAVKGLTNDGTGCIAQTTSATNANPALRAISGGRGSAIIATTAGGATAPGVQSTSGSTQPAVRATGKAVPAGGAVAAGNAAALTVQGVASFTRTGLVTIPATATSNAASPAAVPGGLTATSRVLATMQTTTTTNVGVKSATPNSATGKITITLTAPAPAGGIQVAWFVFG